MQDNTKRGKRTLFWLKTTLILSILCGILGIASGIFGSELWADSDVATQDISAGVLGLFVLLLIACFALVISVGFGGLYLLLWLFRTTENLRTKTETAFSPWGAVIGSCLPYVGQLLHFFIFRNLVKHQEKLLKAYGIEAAPVSMGAIAAWFILAIASGIISFQSDSIQGIVIAGIAGITALFLYIQTLTAYTAQEAKLLQGVHDLEIKKKVEEVLNERERQKAEIANGNGEATPPQDPGKIQGN